MARILKEFFAVTTTSLYRVTAKNKDGWPCAEKIALKGESEIKVGEKLDDGPMLAIATNLRFYVNDGHGPSSPMTSFERRLEHVNTSWWRSCTSKIIALFLNEQDARRCLEESDLKPCDPRWLDKTKEVLEKIGNDHPTISICHHPELCLLRTDS